MANRDAWNDAYSTGTFVRVWQSLPEGDWFVSRTSEPAFIHGRGAAVHVRMACAPIYLRNLTPLTTEVIAMLLSGRSTDSTIRKGDLQQLQDRELPPADRQ